MTLVLDARHVAAIRRHGEADYPAEACGLIGGALEGDRKVAVQDWDHGPNGAPKPAKVSAR